METSRHSNWGYDIRTEVAGSMGKVVVEAPQKTPAFFAKDFASSHDHANLEVTFPPAQACKETSPIVGDPYVEIR